VRRFAGRLGIECGYSAHSMRATFITTAPENGASLEDVPPGIWLGFGTWQPDNYSNFDEL